MRLVDADELIAGRVENDPVVIAAKCAPTSYNVDRVLKLIESIEVSKDSGGVVSGCNQGICESDDCLKCLKNKLIDIVKAGGKDA